MTQYLVAIYRPENYDPAVSEDEAMGREIDALNEEMMAARVRVFAGGLRPESCARSLRLQPAGKVLITDGPYTETKEHIGGFWVLEAADLDEALAWGRKALPSPVGQSWLRCVRFGRTTEATERPETVTLQTGANDGQDVCTLKSPTPPASSCQRNYADSLYTLPPLPPQTCQ